jgi:hypothetical protein
MIIPLMHKTLQNVSTFYDEITVQINYYRVHKKSAIEEDNGFLHQQIRQKIGDKLMAKFAVWADMNSTKEEELPLNLFSVYKNGYTDALHYYEKSKRLADLYVKKRAGALQRLHPELQRTWLMNRLTKKSTTPVQTLNLNRRAQFSTQPRETEFSLTQRKTNSISSSPTQVNEGRSLTLTNSVSLDQWTSNT